jgi:long-chain acyl-CoA synthetase
VSIETLDDVLRTYAADRPEKVALRAGERSWTYAGIKAESAQVAQALLAAGIAPQERVAFLDRNIPEYFTLLFGAAMINGVTLAVNWRLAAPEMEYILNHSQAKVLLIGEEFLGHLAQMNLDTVKQVVVVGSDAGGHVLYQDWIASQPCTDPALPCEQEDVCYQLYTSGTTGLPKGVELTHRNLMAAMHNGAASWGIDGDSVAMVAMPLFHIAGSGWAVAGFTCGAEMVLVYEMDPAEVLSLIETRRVTNTLFVPAVLQVLSSFPQAEKTDFSSMRKIVYGASPISEEVLVRSM